MNIEDVKLELWEIAMAYPTLRGLLKKEIEVMVKKVDLSLKSERIAVSGTVNPGLL